eukprot:g2490.t1
MSGYFSRGRGLRTLLNSNVTLSKQSKKLHINFGEHHCTSWLISQRVPGDTFPSTLHRRHIHATSSTLNMFSAVGDFYTNMKSKLSNTVADAQAKQTEDGKLQQFQSLSKFLVEQEQFTLQEYRTQIDDMIKESGVEGWRGKLAGDDAKAQLALAKRQLALIDACDEPTQSDPIRKLDGRKKRDLANNTGESREFINVFMTQFKWMKVFHGFLRYRSAKGLKMPETMAEMQGLLGKEPQGADMKLMQNLMQNDPTLRAKMRERQRRGIR